MAKRDALNYLGEKVAELEEPSGVTWTEEMWQEKLAKYSKAPPSPQEQLEYALSKTIKDRKEYAEDLLERFKKKNLSEGINAIQGMWMHSRMRAVSFTFYGLPVVIDILNMAVSGDVELACLALMNTAPDDGSQPFHWLTQARINWLVADMKSFLGWS